MQFFICPDVQMSHLKFFTTFILCAAIFLPQDSLAAKKKKPQKPLKPQPVAVDMNRVFLLQDKKRVLTCAYVDARFVAGTLTSDNMLQPSSDALFSINQKIKRLKKKGRNIRAMNKRKSAIKKDVARQTRLCSESSAKLPAEPVVPLEDAYSLEKLTRPVVESDIINLTVRAGFGYSEREKWLNHLSQYGIDSVVDHFVTTRPEDEGLLAKVEDLTDQDLGAVFNHTYAGQRSALFELWTHTNNPYAERMALFLLGLWTVSGDAVDASEFRYAFWDYYKRLQASAYSATDMRALALEITRDPFMLIYLNNELNVKGNPNENYARELMELFTMGTEDLNGMPNYTETQKDGSGDIAVAAKMLTGWRVKRNYTTKKLEPYYQASRHQNGPHTMFAGTAHTFSGESDEDLIAGIFASHPNVRYYYASEILKEYLTPNPPVELIKALGEVIHANNYALRPAMNVLLKSKAFYHPAYRHSLPKTSVEFAVEAVKVLELQNSYDIYKVQRQVDAMGMPVNYAPTVFWFDTAGWTSPTIVLERSNFIGLLLGDSNAHKVISPAWSADYIVPGGEVSSLEVIESVARRLAIKPIPAPLMLALNHYMNHELQSDGSFKAKPYKNTDAALRKQKALGLFYILMASPEFQLK